LVSSLPGFAGNLWLGGFQNHSNPSYSEPAGGWEWVTGEPMNYMDWSSGEPNDGAGSDFVEVKAGGSPSGSWNDVPNVEPMNAGYVVEYDTPLPGLSGWAVWALLLGLVLVGLFVLRRRVALAAH
jgi:hypothetical protein